MSNEFFPSIGSVAQKTDDLPDEVDEVKQPDQQEHDNADEDRPMQEMESLCMNCGEQVRRLLHTFDALLKIEMTQGITRMLLTTIPYFKEVIVMSFLCTHCGNRNNEIQPAGTIRGMETCGHSKTRLCSWARKIRE